MKEEKDRRWEREIGLNLEGKAVRAVEETRKKERKSSMYRKDRKKGGKIGMFMK